MRTSLVLAFFSIGIVSTTSKFDSQICSGLVEPSVLSVDKPMVDTIGNPGDSMILRCQFYAAPQPQITWYHRGKRIESHRSAQYESILMENQLGQSVVESALRIDCLDESTIGEYFCEATSPCSPPVVSHALVSMRKSSPKLSPMRHQCRKSTTTTTTPYIAMFTMTRIELPGGVTQLACRANGSPPPMVSWSRVEEDESLTPIVANGGPSNYMQLPNNDLLIVGDDTTVSESFRCTAENEYGSDYQEASVIYMTA